MMKMMMMKKTGPKGLVSGVSHADITTHERLRISCAYKGVKLIFEHKIPEDI